MMQRPVLDVVMDRLHCPSQDFVDSGSSVGNLLLTSIYEGDQPVIVTYIMLAALIIITANIIVDILYAIINPKIRYD